MEHLFATDAALADVMGLVSQCGSAGLAILSVWWLSSKHEKQLEKRDVRDEKMMGIIDKLADKVEDNTRRLDLRDAIHKLGG